MESLEISVPKSVKAFIDAEVAAGRYGTPSDFIVDLISEAQKRTANERVESLLQEGLDSPAMEMSRNDWQDLKQRARERHSPRNHP